MADEQSTGTGVDETTDTGSDEDQDTDDGSLEDIEVNPEDIGGSDDEAEQSESTTEPEDTDTASEEEAEEPEETTDDTEEEPEQSDEDKRKQQAKEQYERRQAERQAREDRIRQDQQAYIAEADKSEDPKELAVRELQVEAYNNKVERLSNTLTNQYERAVKDFDILTTNDPVIQAEIDATIDAFQAQHVTLDPYGNPSDVRGDLYAALQAKADSIAKLTGIRVAKQEQSKAKQKSKAMTVPTRAPKEPAADPDLAAFDEEAYGK